MENNDKITGPGLEENKVTQEDLLALVESQGALIAEQQEKISVLERQTKELRSAAPKSPAPVAASGTFKVGGKEYKVLHGVRIRRDGVLVTVSAADILSNKELREDLVKTGSTAVAPA